MGEIAVGDQVFDEQGRPCTVTLATDVMRGRQCFDVVFDDGAVITADAEHLWLTKTYAVRKAEGRRRPSPNTRGGRPQCTRRHFPSLATTEQIRATLLHAGRERNHSIDLALPMLLPAAELPIEPYTLGVWLGNGDAATSAITTGDKEQFAALAAAGTVCGTPKPDARSKAVRASIGCRGPVRDAATGRMLPNGSLHSDLRAAGLLGNKHVPAVYQRASTEQRRALLSGLLDTDGSCSPGGTVEFSTTTEALAHGTLELVLGLGFKATMAEGRAMLEGRDCGPKWRITFTPHSPVFRLTRKRTRQHSGKTQRSRTHVRYIVEVRPRESAPVRCIQVDSPSHLFLAGKSFVPTHNTRSGAEWIRERVESGIAKRIYLVGATAADVRDVMIEGESGLMAISSPWCRPRYEPSKRRVTWPNGAIGTTFSAEEPDRLRGPQADTAWGDEFAAWKYPDAWDQLRFGLRLGGDPRAVITTTPRPTAEVRTLMADPTTAVTRGTTYENRGNLAAAFFAAVVKKYEGTRLGRQELDGAVLEDNPGALWTQSRIEALRVRKAPEFRRIVVAIDPAVTSNAKSDETGIVVAGLGTDGHTYVLEDGSGKYTPDGWARFAVNRFKEWKADRVVAEVNNGGDLVETVIRSVDAHVPYRAVHAARGKQTRAEPIAALYEQGKVHHVGGFPALEDQMTTWDPATGEKSPDRIDALVWALSDLIVNSSPPASISDFRSAMATAPKTRF